MKHGASLEELYSEPQQNFPFLEEKRWTTYKKSVDLPTNAV
jgi:hypothetical protein